MEILKRCLSCEKKGVTTLQLINDNGWIEWRKNDPVVIMLAKSQQPPECLTDGIDYVPAVLECGMCQELPPVIDNC